MAPVSDANPFWYRGEVDYYSVPNGVDSTFNADGRITKIGYGGNSMTYKNVALSFGPDSPWLPMANCKPAFIMCIICEFANKV